MATLYVKDLPDDVYDALKERARANGRSVSAEVRQILLQAAPPLRTRKEVAESIRRFREKIAGEAREIAVDEVVKLVEE